MKSKKGEELTIDDFIFLITDLQFNYTSLI